EGIDQNGVANPHVLARAQRPAKRRGGECADATAEIVRVDDRRTTARAVRRAGPPRGNAFDALAAEAAHACGGVAFGCAAPAMVVVALQIGARVIVRAGRERRQTRGLACAGRTVHPGPTRGAAATAVGGVDGRDARCRGSTAVRLVHGALAFSGKA